MAESLALAAASSAARADSTASAVRAASCSMRSARSWDEGPDAAGGNAASAGSITSLKVSGPDVIDTSTSSPSTSPAIENV